MIGSTMIDMGKSPLMTVPYALFAINGGGNDDDADPENEIQDLFLDGTTLSITNNGSATYIDLSPFQGTNTDEQTLALIGTELSIANGNMVDLSFLPDEVDDADADPTNEIQDLQLTGDELSITNNITATPIDLGAYNESSVGWSRDGDNVVYVNGNVGVGTITPEGRLSVQGVSETAEEPLFMVKRKDGYPVFAVFEDGVYAYTDTVDTGKGIKGGFAVGGYKQLDKGIGTEYMRVTADSIRFYIDQDTSGGKSIKGGFAVGGFKQLDKGGIPGDEFLRISPDSVRIYIDDDPDAKGLKGGFAVGGYKQLYKGNAEYFNISGQNSAEVIAGENRVVWYPQRNAFLSGKVLVNSGNDVGENSMASGYESQAKGDYSQAFGYRSITTGPFSMAIGETAVADTSSFAFGKNALATGNESYAFGSGAEATGLRSFSLGSVGLDSMGIPVEESPTRASGTYSIAMGLGALAEKKGSMSFGVSSEATEQYALSMGYGSKAFGINSLAIGSRANYSESVNYPAPFIYQHYGSNIAWEPFAIAIGSGNQSKAGGLSIGLSNYANGWGSVSMGMRNTSTGEKSLAAGYRSEATGKYAVAIGNYVSAQAFNSTAIGSFNAISGSTSSWVATDPLFVVGNGENKGASTVRSNAFMVTKNGNAFVYGILYGSKQIKAYGALLSDSLVLGSYKSMMVNTRPVITMKEYKNFPIPSYTKEYSIKVSGQKFIIADESVSILNISPGNLDVVGNIQFDNYLVGAFGTIASSRDEWLRLNDGNSHTSGVYISSLLRADGGIRVGDDEGFYWGGEDVVRSDDHLHISGRALCLGGVHVGGTSDPGIDNLVVDGDVTISGGDSKLWHGTTALHFRQDETASFISNKANFVGNGSSANGAITINGQGGVILSYGTVNSAGTPGVILNTSGNVGIGTTSSGYYKLYVSGVAYATGSFISSDRKFKENIEDVKKSLSILDNVRGVSYTWKRNEYPDRGFGEGRHYGVIAQELEEVLPTLVMTDEKGDLSVSYTEFIPIIIEAVKEQQEIIEEKDQRIDELEARIEKMEAFLNLD